MEIREQRRRHDQCSGVGRGRSNRVREIVELLLEPQKHQREVLTIVEAGVRYRQQLELATGD
jgi:hypothetical protein